MIGDNVEITILDIRGDKVRLGIRAPAEIPVHRKEVYLAIQDENLQAAGTETASLNQAMLIFKKRTYGVSKNGMETD